MLSELTRLVLVNAIYFKADWKTQFDKAKTEERDFYTEDQGAVKVPMMHLESTFEMASLPELGGKMLRLPYKGDRIVMEVLLPDSRDP